MNHAHRIATGLPALIWTIDDGKYRTCSNAGHVITGARLSTGGVCYNAWAGEPHESKHLEQGVGEAGLLFCKAACERHFSGLQRLEVL